VKIKELIKQLERLDKDLEVIIAKDPEGNGFNYLQEIDKTNIIKEESCLYDAIICNEDLFEYSSDEYKGAVILWP